MKKLLIAILALTLSTSAIAQHNMKMDPKAGSHAKMGKDCVMMKDGKMMMTKGGKTMPMTKDKIMTNGTKVKTDGTIMKKGGKMSKMKEGDMMDMKGKMGTMDKDMDMNGDM